MKIPAQAMWAAICLTLSLPLCVQALGQHVVFEETFDGYQEGALTGQNYWSGSGSGEVVAFGDGQSLGQRISASGSAINDKYARLDTGSNTIATFSINVFKSNNTSNTFALGGFVDASASSRGVVFGLSAGNLIYWEGISGGTSVVLTDADGTAVATAPGVWYRVRAEIDIGGSAITSAYLKNLETGEEQQVYFGSGKPDYTFVNPVSNWNLVRLRTPRTTSAANAAGVNNLRLTVPNAVPDPRYDWSQATQLHDGILHSRLELLTPRRMVINALRVDLRHPNIRLAGNPRARNWSANATEAPIYTTRRFISTQRAQGINMVVAINAEVFSHNAANPEGTAVNVNGLALDRGDFVSAPQPNYDYCLLYDRAWETRIERIPLDFDSSNILTAVTGFGFAIRDGGPVGSTTFGNQPDYPQTCLGLSEDRRYLVMMTVDGRQTGYSQGATVRESGEFLWRFGAFQGLQMDGGGSTTMATYVSSNNTVQLLNRPSERTIFGQVSERRVASNLGIYYISTPEPIAFEDWLKHRGVPPASRGPLDAPNASGIANLLAYALNIHPMRGPTVGDINAAPAVSVAVGPNNTSFLEYRFRKNRHVTNLLFDLESSSDLSAGSWHVPIDLITETVGTDPLTGDTLYRARLPLSTGPRTFLRLKASPDNGVGDSDSLISPHTEWCDPCFHSEIIACTFE